MEQASVLFPDILGALNLSQQLDPETISVVADWALAHEAAGSTPESLVG